jgi:acetyltransferase-like isoleucine patch superfamily enzyme
MGYLTAEQLAAVGFKSVGKNVLISDKASIYNADQISLGNNSRVDDFCVLSGKIRIGRNVHITVFCNLAGGEQGIVIGDYATLAYGCHVFSQSDDYSGRTMTNSTIPARFKHETKEPVTIGEHCIVGTASLIFPGVTLAEGTSVGAMSLVNKSTEAWSVYVGSPAKKIKDRQRDLLELKRAYLAENPD